MKIEYIGKVLSHIKKSKRAKEIEYELLDHIDEHEKFFEDIGYDEEKALSKAEEKMGDADVLGEQFKAIEKRSSIPFILLNEVLVFAIPVCFLHMVFPTEYFGYFDAFAFVPAVILFALFSLDVIFSIKRKSIVGTVISMLAFYVLYIAVAAIVNGIEFCCEKSSIVYILFYEYANVILYVLCIVFLTAQISTIIIKIKTLRQCNRRFDIKFLKVMQAVVSVITVVCLLACALFLPKMMINTEEVRNQLNDANHKVVQNIDSLVGCDYNGAKAWVEENFSDYTIDSEYWDEGMQGRAKYFSKDYHIEIVVNLNDNNDVSLYVENNCEFYTSDPDYDLYFYFDSDYDYMKNEVSKQSNAKDISLVGNMYIYEINNPNKTSFELDFGNNECERYCAQFKLSYGDLICYDLSQHEC